MIGWWRERRAKQLLQRALHSAARQNYEQAIRECSAALLLTPNAAQAYQQRAMWHHLGGHPEQALADYHKALELAPSAAQLYLERGQVLAEHGDHPAALVDYEAALRLEPRNETAYRLQGASYMAIDNLEAAQAAFSQAVQLNPKSIINYRHRAELYALQGNFKNAIQDYSTALKQLDTVAAQVGDALGDILPQQQLDLLVQRGMAHHLQGNLASAKDDLDHALRLAPDHAAALNARGKVRYQMGEGGAAADFERALELDPQRYATYLNLGEVYCSQKDYDRAYALFDGLNQREPDTLIALAGLALVEHARGQRREAIQRWQRLVAHDSQLADVKWVQRHLLPQHPVLMREAGNLIIRL